MAPGRFLPDLRSRRRGFASGDGARWRRGAGRRRRSCWASWKDWWRRPIGGLAGSWRTWSRWPAARPVGGGGTGRWQRRCSVWLPGRRPWKVAAGEARTSRGDMAWCSPYPRRICVGDLVVFATDWFRSETVTSARDPSRRLSRFGEAGWQPSSQAPVGAHSGRGRCARAPTVALLLRLVAGSRRLDLGL